MKILINSINFFPDLTGIGKYSGEMAAWLKKSGYDVRVVTAPPYYPAWKVSLGYSTMLYRCENLEGVLVYRCPLWVPESPSGLKRIIHLASFAISSFPMLLWHALTWRPDVVFTIEPPLFCAPGALLAARSCGASSWLHIQDFEVDAAFDLGILQSQQLKALVVSVESWLMRRFNRVSTISDRMMQKLTKKGVQTDRLKLFQNWIDVQQIKPLENESCFRDKLSIPEGASVILYSGNMGKKQGLDIIVEAAKSLQDKPEIYFVLCGDGAVRKELEESVKSLKNIQFIPLQPIEKLNELLSLADIHILPQKPGVEDLVMPSKLTNMLASGRPVIAMANKGTEIGDIVTDCGISVEPNDFDRLVDTIAELAGNREERRRLGRSARIFAVNSWEKNKILSQVFSGSSLV